MTESAQPDLNALKAAIVLPYPDEPADMDAIFAQPVIHSEAWVAPNAVVMGRVTLKARASIWYNCVLRGDLEYIEVGEETNVQDGSVLHTDFARPCILGKQVTLGHNVVVHGSVVEDGALIGISATILTGCVIGAGALIAAGALVLEGTVVPPHTLWAGAPARKLKELNAEQRHRLLETNRHYVNNIAIYRARFGRGQ